MAQVQLAWKIAPLQVGQAAIGNKWVLFRNKTWKIVPVLSDDVIGYAKIAEVGHINQEWLDHMHRSPVAHRVNIMGKAKGNGPDPAP